MNHNMPHFFFFLESEYDFILFSICRADLNGDQLLTLQELARFINGRIRDHIELSIRNNPLLFSEIDRSPRNGLITWDEYNSYFLKTLGYDEKFIRKIDRKRFKELDRKSKAQIMKDKALWNEAARTDSFSLTLDEFLAFRHPGINLNLVIGFNFTAYLKGAVKFF